MSFSISKVGTIARREYFTTVRRPAFVISLLMTPLIFMVAGVFSTKSQVDDAVARMSRAAVVALVDSSGLFTDAPLTYDYRAPARFNLVPTRSDGPAPPPKTVSVIFRHYDSQAAALDSLARGDVGQVLIVSSDYLDSGRLRLYEHDTRVFTISGDDRPLRNWLTRNLLRGQTDSLRIARTLGLGRSIDFFTQDREGRWGLKDDAKELAGFLLPFALGFLLAMAIITGGQYLLQGVSEEKETRILESLLCSVSPDELLAGKLLGLGSAGLTLVGVWITAGAYAGGSSLAFLNISLPPSLIAAGILYFLFGYLFYASIMIGVGAITSNLREATQYASYLTILNVCPFWFMMKILNTPNSPLAVGLSMFPPTAATSMMLRMSAAAVSGAEIPAWQVGTSLSILAISAALTLMLGSRLFRLGMLLYGKTPNLPEITRILRQK